MANPPPVPHRSDSPVNAIIPYKNPLALTAYYLGVFSLIPVLGILLGIAAVWLGIAGLKRRKAQPHLGGAAHAWIGIVLGGFSVFGQLALILVLTYAGPRP